MSYISGLVFGLVILFILFFSIRTLLRLQWVTIWLRSTLALAGITACSLSLLSAYDLFSFSGLDKEEQVAKIKVHRQGEQSYIIAMTHDERLFEAKQYEIKGDEWRLEAKVIIWEGVPTWVGHQMSYKLDRISGRYRLLDDELNKPKSVYAVHEETSLIDVWALVADNPWIPGIKAKQGAATYLPMKNGAEYEVLVSERGLIAKPLNPIAEQTVEAWE